MYERRVAMTAPAMPMKMALDGEDQHFGPDHVDAAVSRSLFVLADALQRQTVPRPADDTWPPPIARTKTMSMAQYAAWTVSWFHETAAGAGDYALHLEDDVVEQQHHREGEDAEVDASQSECQGPDGARRR